MGSVILQHLPSAWHVDQAIVRSPSLLNSTAHAMSDATLHYAQINTPQLREEARIVCLRFGADYTPECMEMDEMLYKIVDAVKDWVVIYVVDNKVLSPSFPSPFLLPSPPYLSCHLQTSLTPLPQQQVPDFNAMY